MEVLTKEVIASFKDAARKLTGPKRRAFEAQVTLDYLEGNIWKAEKVFGWSHHTVALGLNELRTGITCMDNFSARGNRKTEAKSPELEADIRALAEPESQADPEVPVALLVHANDGQGGAASAHRPERLDR